MVLNVWSNWNNGFDCLLDQIANVIFNLGQIWIIFNLWCYTQKTWNCHMIDIPYSTFSTQKSQIEDQKISKSNMYLVKTEWNNSVLRQDIVHFLEKMRTREFAFEIFWPLQQSICAIKNMQYVRSEPFISESYEKIWHLPEQ